jgi:glycosyltransferase involved in cell wall biosynthesis
MNIRKLSIIIPAYNEANTIAQILYGVINVPLPSGIEKEIIIIDDCSTDNTALQVSKVQQSNPNAHIIYPSSKKIKEKDLLYEQVSNWQTAKLS